MKVMKRSKKFTKIENHLELDRHTYRGDIKELLEYVKNSISSGCTHFIVDQLWEDDDTLEYLRIVGVHEATVPLNEDIYRITQKKLTEEEERNLYALLSAKYPGQEIP